ncbi:MAG: hypothetical protein RLZZ272_327 [Actinomycetota bacterium]
MSAGPTTSVLHPPAPRSPLRVPCAVARSVERPVVAVLALVALLAATLLPGVPAAADDVGYRLPVAGGVLRRFEPTTGPYGPGHRGVDLDAAPGTTVGAAADGVVAFAGSVAGVRWVSVDHADGIRTSYGPMSGIAVGVGEEVVRGQRLGRLASGGHGERGQDRGLHFGARRDGVYLDPLLLPGIRLPRPALVGEGGWWASGHTVTPYEPWDGAWLAGLHYHPSPAATAPGWSVPPNPNHVIVVGGFASSGSAAPIDVTHVGYDPASVTHLSYAGRDDALARTRPVTDARRDQLAYEAPDTWAGVDAAARRLADQLRAQAEREPGRAVDLVGHSMGGFVLLWYLTQYHDAYDVTLPPIAHVVTIASPLEGSDLARLGTELTGHPGLGPGLVVLRDRLAAGDSRLAHGAQAIDPRAPAVGQLATGSALLGALADGWQASLEAGGAGALAMGTRVLTIGGGADRVVGADRAGLPGGSDPGTALAGPVASHRVLPGSHSGVLDTQAVREVVRGFLADEEVVASPGIAATLVAGGVGTTLRLTGEAIGAHGRLRGTIVGDWTSSSG